MMLMRSGNRMSIGVMAEDAHLWVQNVQQELFSLQRLVQQSKASTGGLVSS